MADAFAPADPAQRLGAGSPAARALGRWLPRLAVYGLPTALILAPLAAASADLGARPGQTFRTVVLPLSLPGSIVGGLFVMVLALGDFLTPQMVGGNQGFTFGRAIWSQFGMAFNWPFGAALAVVLLLAVAAVIGLAALVSRHARVK